MLKVNNFDKIRKLLVFENENNFYFLQILKRRKDNPGMKRDVKNIENFFIYSVEQYDSLMGKIIDICDLNNARACLRLNVRSWETIALQVLKMTTDAILHKQYKNVRKAYLSCCGKFNSEKNGDKKWIIDIDDISMYSDIIKFLNDNDITIVSELGTRN